MLRKIYKENTVLLKIDKLTNHITSYLSGNQIKFIHFSKDLKVKFKNKQVKILEVFLDWLILKNSESIQSIEVLHRKRFEGKTNYDFKSF